MCNYSMCNKHAKTADMFNPAWLFIDHKTYVQASGDTANG